MKKVVGIHETGKRARKSDNTIYDRVDLFIVTDEIPEEYIENFQGLYAYQYYIEKDEVKLTGASTWADLVEKEIDFRIKFTDNTKSKGIKIAEVYVVK